MTQSTQAPGNRSIVFLLIPSRRTPPCTKTAALVLGLAYSFLRGRVRPRPRLAPAPTCLWGNAIANRMVGRTDGKRRFAGATPRQRRCAHGRRKGGQDAELDAELRRDQQRRGRVLRVDQRVRASSGPRLRDARSKLGAEDPSLGRQLRGQAVAGRLGRGRTRHIEVRFLWLQDS